MWMLAGDAGREQRRITGTTGCGPPTSMLRYAASMAHPAGSKPSSYHAFFDRQQLASGEYQLARKSDAPGVISDPSGRVLKIATFDAGARAICPSCAAAARGAFMSFVQDLRMAYACPSCSRMTWLNGA